MELVVLDKQLNHWEWLTWVFVNSNDQLRRQFYCSLWVIWVDRNIRIHEKKVCLGSEIEMKINNYILELDNYESKNLTPRSIMQD